jgi:hypothetical protein
MMRFPARPDFILWSHVFVLTIALPMLVSAADTEVKGIRGVPVRQTRDLTEFDSILGWRRIPNFHGTHIQGEYQVEMRYNARGFRGPLYPYERTPQTYRILILGDSYADGYSVEYDDLFTETMQEQLKTKIKKPLEVVNSAVGGYGTDQQLLYFLIDGRRYKPDLTILLFYANDLPYNIKSNYAPLGRGEKPLFALEDGKLYLKSLPKPPRDRTPDQRKDFYDPKLVKQTMEMFARPKAAAGDSPSASVEKDGAVYGSGTKRTQWEMTEALMKKIKESCDANESHLLLFFVPVKRDIYGRTGVIENKPSGVSSNLRVLASRLKIDLIDTLPMYRDRAEQIAKQKQRSYWVRDSHWTPQGHHLAGEIIARHLAERCKHYGLCD